MKIVVLVGLLVAAIYLIRFLFKVSVGLTRNVASDWQVRTEAQRHEKTLSVLEKQRLGAGMRESTRQNLRAR